jgi:hypothetical protein
MGGLSNLNGYSNCGIFGFALLLGILHVLLGPDHVTAVVALVSGVKRRQHGSGQGKVAIVKKTAMQGFRWSVGHTVGLGFMTGIFMLFRSQIPIDTISTVSDIIVGSLMILLGCISLINLYFWRKKDLRINQHITDIETIVQHPSDGVPMEVVSGSEAHVDAHTHEFTHVHLADGDIRDSKSLWDRLKLTKIGENFSDNERGAYTMGTFHGVSGLSGIVYTLPSLFIENNVKLILYLFGFFASSITSMTLLGGILGLTPGGKKSIMVTNLIAGTSVIGVGMMWLILTSQGKLNL